MFQLKKGCFINPLVTKKEVDEFLERRESILQKHAKLSTPSEKALIFEITDSPKKVKSFVEMAKSKNRTPLLLSTKR